MNGLLLEALYAKYHADKTDAVSKLEVLAKKTRKTTT